MDYKRKQFAIALKGDEVFVINNYPLWKKDKNTFIYEDCNEDLVKDKFAYWNRIVHYDALKIKQQELEFLEKCK